VRKKGGALDACTNVETNRVAGTSAIDWRFGARDERARGRLWEFVRVSPTKWQQHPWGDEGGGFWVVGLFGNRALWYNDIELGFNASSYDQFGTISDYVCNQEQPSAANLRMSPTYR